jgi:osmoprotectant transport system ATP-binding protein
MIRFQDVSKSFGGTQVLEPIQLELEGARTTVLIGPSGCGKSTLLRMLVGLVEPDSGSVSVAGLAISRTNLRSIRHGIGYVIQEGGLFPHLSAYDNVALLGRHLGRSQAQLATRIDELCGLARLDRGLLSRLPLELSGGQRQRVALMRALLTDPPILLLDEPLSALDPIIRFALQQDLKDIFARLQKTVVFVTHDMNEAAYLGERIVLMRAGRIVQMGSLEDLLLRPADPFVTEFIGAQRSMLPRNQAQ